MTSSTTDRVQLLLHTEDGFIPFLTPYLLQNYFAPDSQDIKDHLVLGVAVKDTCIGPMYRDDTKNESGDDVNKDGSENDVQSKNKNNNKNKNKRKRKKDDPSDDNIAEVADAADTTNGNASKRQRTEENNHTDNEKKKKKSNALKPVGYKFDSVTHQQLLSAQIPGYNSMIFPTFDLIDDLNHFTNGKTSTVNENNYGKKNKGKGKKEKDKHQNGNGNRPTIASTNNHVSLCTPHGVQKLDLSTYLKITSDLEVDSFIGMFDQVYVDDKKKRREKCIERTKKWMEMTTQQPQPEQKENMNKRKKKQIWYPLDCAANFPDDKAFVKDDVLSIIPQNDSIAGVVMVGWHHRNSKEERMKLLQKCYNNMQSHSLKFIVPATNDLSQVIEAVKYGASMFGCDLAARWARARKALALTITPDQNWGSTVKIGDSKNLDKDGCIDLSNPSYASDKSPIVPDCLCFPAKYTKSYIHHLIQGKELLADIILFGHNLHQMISLCKEFSRARNEGKIDEYCIFVQNQLQSVN